MEALKNIQQKLKAPKNQYNNFGKYKYRNCEDILEAVKPLLENATLTINDEIVMVGERFYVKATATLKDGKEEVSTTAYARESIAKKGMDDAQVTGATSSYARKYALNGLFLIDDTKDADNQDNTNVDIEKIQKEVGEILEIESLREYYASHKGLGKEVSDIITKRSKEITLCNKEQKNG